MDIFEKKSPSYNKYESRIRELLNAFFNAEK